MNSANKNRTKVFISYSHRDEKWLKRLQVHLKPLVREFGFDFWDDTNIITGSKWRDEIGKAIQAAKVAVLLISPDFLASDFIANNELPPLLKAAEEDGALVLPLLISTSRFQRTWTLSQYQAVNLPTSPLNKMNEGEVDDILDRLAQRIENYLNAELSNVQKDKQNIPLLLEQAESHRLSGRFQEALETANHVLSIDSQNIAALLVRALTSTALYNQQEQAMQDAKRILEFLYQDQSSLGMAQKALAYYLLSTFDEAIQHSTAALELDPRNIIALRARAASYLAIKEYAKVIKDTSYIIDIERWNTVGLRLRGNAYYCLGRNEEAIKDLNLAVHLSPGYWYTLDIRASVLNKLGKNSEAIKDLTDLLEIAPGYHSARRFRAAIYADTEKYPDAIADATELLLVEPNDATMLSLRAFSYASLGICEKALKDARKALEIDPNDKHALNVLRNC